MTAFPYFFSDCISVFFRRTNKGDEKLISSPSADKIGGSYILPDNSANIANYFISRPMSMRII